jgi:hypothetical protein
MSSVFKDIGASRSPTSRRGSAVAGDCSFDLLGFRGVVPQVKVGLPSPTGAARSEWLRLLHDLNLSEDMVLSSSQAGLKI